MYNHSKGARGLLV